MDYSGLAKILTALDGASLSSLVMALILFVSLPGILKKLKDISFQVHREINAKDDFRDTIKDKMESSVIVNKSLDCLLTGFNADRAYVAQYHNGLSNMAGVPFAKISITHERCQVGVTSQIQNLQNLPIAVASHFNEAIMHDRVLCLPDITEVENIDFSTYQLLHNQGILSLYAVGIQDFDGVPVGFVGIDFCRGAKALDEEELLKLKATAIKICGLILSTDRCTLVGG